MNDSHCTEVTDSSCFPSPSPHPSHSLLHFQACWNEQWADAESRDRPEIFECPPLLDELGFPSIANTSCSHELDVRMRLSISAQASRGGR